MCSSDLKSIELMARHYAGVAMLKPCGHLENFLAGKQGDQSKSTDKIARAPWISELKVQLDVIKKQIETADARNEKQSGIDLRKRKREIESQIVNVR